MDVNSSGIYQIRNLANGKRYIGSAKCFRDRWRVHESSLRRGTHHSAYLQRSWNTHGAECFVFEIIELCSIPELIQKEQSWLDSHRPEYNVSPTAANCTGVKHSDATKLKHTLAMKGRKFPDAAAKRTGMKRTPDQRARMSAAQKEIWASKSDEQKTEFRAAARSAVLGRKQSSEEIERRRKHLFGRRMSDSTKAALRAANTGRKLSSEQREARSIARKGRKITGEWLDNIRAAAARRIGVSRPDVSARLSGRVVSEETKFKISAANTGKRLSHEAIAKRTATRRANGSYVLSEETKRKIAAAHSGVPKSREAIDKMMETKRLKRYMRQESMRMGA